MAFSIYELVGVDFWTVFLGKDDVNNWLKTDELDDLAEDELRALATSNVPNSYI